MFVFNTNITKFFSLLSLTLAVIILFWQGSLFIGTTEQYDSHRLIKGYFVSSHENSSFFVCNGESQGLNQYRLGNIKSLNLLMEDYNRLNKGVIKPIYFEIQGEIIYSKRTEQMLIRFPDIVIVSKINIALDLENLLCPYPNSLVKMGYSSLLNN